MRIDQAGVPETVLPGPRARRRQPGFAVPGDGESAETAEPARTAPAAPVTMPSLPEPTGTPAAFLDDGAAATQGAAVLSAMTGLQLAALGGGGEAARQHLAALAKTLPAAADPALDSVLQAIAQRAAVELARQE